MSIFNELILPKIMQISSGYNKRFKDNLQATLDSLDKLEEDLNHQRISKTREQSQKSKNKTVLQSIDENEDGDVNKTPKDNNAKLSNGKPDNGKSNDTTRSTSSSGSQKARKRSKDEVDDILSPEIDKRQKRNASVKAQSIISKQVNVNLNQKMRRDEEETITSNKESHGRRGKMKGKENVDPVTLVQVKSEKISILPETMDMESEALPVNIRVKQEQDSVAMPPPAAPKPKPRRAIKGNKSDDTSDEESSGKHHTTRKGKQTDALPQPVPAPRVRASARASARASTRASTRSSSRVINYTEIENEPIEPVTARPKRTRNKKKVVEDAWNNSENEIKQLPEVNGFASPAEKPRPKRTRRAKKDADKEPEKPKSPEEPEKPKTPEQPKKLKNSDQPEKPKRPEQPEKLKSPEQPENPKAVDLSKEIESILQSESIQSPIIQMKSKTKNKLDDTKSKVDVKEITRNGILDNQTDKVVNMKEARIQISDVTVTLDKTVTLPNGINNYAPASENVPKMNETVVIAVNRETIVLENQKRIMDATVVIDKGHKHSNITADDSLLTDDNSFINESPPRKEMPAPQPLSAVKEKVQQFEELASRVTRTKTRNMAKMEENTETETPPDKVSKTMLSTETLNKMNGMIFNGKTPQISSSATKLRTNAQVKSYLPVSASKMQSFRKSKDVLEEGKKEERKRKEEETKREDARKKKEALLEAKKEQQRRKREQKMAAAAATREAAERERLAGIEAALRERMEKQAHADQGKIERMKEAEKKKQELARKVAETEERRKAEEQARQQRLAEEQKRAEALRKKQQEEVEITKKEAAIMAKEMEKRQKEYLEKQKKQRKEAMNTPLKVTKSVRSHMEPVYMEDGFEYLNSDEEWKEPANYIVPDWSRTLARRHQLLVQAYVRSALADKLFALRVHSPDLREIFPNIDRRDLKRTSSAVWRTPPTRLNTVQEHAI